MPKPRFRPITAGPLYGLIAVLILAACDGGGSAPPAGIALAPTPVTRIHPHFAQETAPCPWDLPAVRAQTPGLTIRCGYVAVPEHHRQPEGPQLRLAVLVAQRDPAHPTASAVIYLAGGPGNTAGPGDLVPLAAAGEDVIVYDQRGVGYSVPALNCPPVGGRDPLTAALEAQGALASCRLQLIQAGVHLDAYTIPESAADVNDIRQALGYAQLDLYGLSYGTKLALAVLRDFPATARSAVLDSVLPMQAQVATDLPTHIAGALHLAFGACATDPACHQAYPALEAVYAQVVADLDAHPAAVATRVGTIAFTGAHLTSLLLALLISGPQHFPDFIYRLKRGDYGALGQFLDDMQAPSTTTAWVMSFSVVCSDGEYGTAQSGATAAAPLAAGLREPLVAGVRALVQLCDGWPVSHVGPTGQEAVQSDVPTLVLEGTFDPITPPAYGRLAAQTLAHSYYVEFPDRGHAVGGHDTCAGQIVSQFLRQPTTAPDTRCTAGLRPSFSDPAEPGGVFDPAKFPLSRDEVLAAVAPALHLTVAELRQRVDAGRSLADVAQTQHVSRQQVADAILAHIQSQLAAAVQAGTLAQAEADQIYQKVKEGGLDPLLNGK